MIKCNFLTVKRNFHPIFVTIPFSIVKTEAEDATPVAPLPTERLPVVETFGEFMFTDCATTFVSPVVVIVAFSVAETDTFVAEILISLLPMLIF